MPYTRRVVDNTLDRMMLGLAAVSIDGAKGVGKTETAKQRAATVLDMSILERHAAVMANPDLIVQVPEPVFIDEWQLAETVWNRVKHAVDDDDSPGRFLLAGSATVRPESRIHTGAGRIVSLRLRPMALAERGICTPTVSLRELLDGHSDAISGISTMTVPDYVDEILASGFPGIRRLPGQDFRDDQLRSYLDLLLNREMQQAGINVRKPAALHAWMTAYAAATASAARYTTIRDAATSSDADPIARNTADAYRDHLTRVFILDPLPAWISPFNPLKRLSQAPKHHLADPALAANLMGVSKGALLIGEGQRISPHTGTWLGALFESLATLCVRVYADAARARTGHMIIADGRSSREVDIIVEGSDRRVVACEVKLSSSVSDNDVRHLNWLHQQIGDRLADKIVLNTGDIAYRRRDGVAVIPLALLGP
ncbi:MAG: DUF4143 domain-containing protein [Cellulomonadaceae bacterium]|jgi:predicted AAA+ superfamily ATPase|nr:DUF4143 domain-containing protein [Cellulomonadaceae bacterium]